MADDDKHPDGPSLDLPPLLRRRRRGPAGASASEDAPEVSPRTPVPDDSPRPGNDEGTPTRTVPTTSPEPGRPDEPDEPDERPDDRTAVVPSVLVPSDTATAMAALPVPTPVTATSSVAAVREQPGDEPLRGAGAERAPASRH